MLTRTPVVTLRGRCDKGITEKYELIRNHFFDGLCKMKQRYAEYEDILQKKMFNIDEYQYYDNEGCFEGSEEDPPENNLTKIPISNSSDSDSEEWSDSDGSEDD